MPAPEPPQATVESSQTAVPENGDGSVKSDAVSEPAAATVEPPATKEAPPVAAYDPVALLVGGTLTKAAEEGKTADPVVPNDLAPTQPEVTADATPPTQTVPETAEPAVAATTETTTAAPETAVPPPTRPTDPVAALVGGALAKAAAEGDTPKDAKAGEAPGVQMSVPAADDPSPASPTATSPPQRTKDKVKKAGFFGRMWGGEGKDKDNSKEKEPELKPVPAAAGSFAFGTTKDGFGSPVASGPGSPEVSSPENEKEDPIAEGEETKAGEGGGDSVAPVDAVAPAVTTTELLAPVMTAGPATPAVPETAAIVVQAPVAAVASSSTAAGSSTATALVRPATATAAELVRSKAIPRKEMNPAEKAASANVLALLQRKPSATASPTKPRLLSRADALSVRVHASSALVPNSSIISPVVRIHLVEPEMGSPVRPSGEASTPLQTAPFDLSCRRNASFAAEWEETLEIEEALGDIMGARAVMLFEVLQPPPSFQYYEEKYMAFPGGQPMRVAWGFLKLLRIADGKPNMGRLKVQMYKWDNRVSVMGGMMGASAGQVTAAQDAPDVFREWKRASIVPPALRQLYPAHLDVTVTSSPRGDTMAALLSAPRPGADTPRLAIAPPPALQKTLSGLGKVENHTLERRPSRRDRIDRERALGGGWRNAEARLRRAPEDDQTEIVEQLGRLPHETLCYGMNPAAAAAAREAQAIAEAEAATPGLSGSKSWKNLPVKATVVKLPHSRQKQETCLLPNADARTQPHLPNSVTEATLASFDPMGRRLAVVAREAGMYVVRVFDTSTGTLIVAFPGHASTVYDVAWAPEVSSGAGNVLGTVDFAAPATRVVTASADGAARAWRVHAFGEDTSVSATHRVDVVAQHACEVYAAAWHPTTPRVLATGSRDGGVRIWSVEDGVPAARLITGLAVAPGVAATAMGFDRTGMRLWVGFADGVIRELRVDVKGGANEPPSIRPLRECKDLLGEPVTCLRVAPTDRRVFARTVADRIAAIDVSFFAATHTFDCSGSAGSTMRAIRGAGLGAFRGPAEQSGASAGTADGAFAGVTGAASAGRPLARFDVSPDGHWIVAGTADGTARVFDVDVKGSGVLLAAASAPPGVRINDVAWSPGAHCMSVCAAQGSRPVRLTANTEHAPQVVPPPRPQRLLELGTASDGKPSQKVMAAMKAQRESSGFGPPRERPQLPGKLTPEAVRAMLAQVRVQSTQDRQLTMDNVRRSRAGTPRRASPPSAAAAPGYAAAPQAPYGGAQSSARRDIAADWQKENVQVAAPVPQPVVPQNLFDPYGGNTGAPSQLAQEVGALDKGKAPATGFGIAGDVF